MFWRNGKSEENKKQNVDAHDKLTLFQYFGQRPFSRKNMHFSINYIVSGWNRDYVVDTKVHVFS